MKIFFVGVSYDLYSFYDSTHSIVGGKRGAFSDIIGGGSFV